MSLVNQELWNSELADIPMPDGATYADFHTLAVEKHNYELERDIAKFEDGLKRLAAQRPMLKDAIMAHLESENIKRGEAQQS